MEGSCDSDNEKDDIDFAWKWFDFHAKQRQSNIQFSFTLIAGLLAAIGYLLNGRIYFISSLFSSFGALCSIVFLGLDHRNSFLVKLSEAHIVKYFDSRSIRYPNYIAVTILRDADSNNNFEIKYKAAANYIFGFSFVVFSISLFFSLFQFIKSLI